MRLRKRGGSGGRKELEVALRAEIARLTEREKVLRDLLIEAHEQLIRRDDIVAHLTEDVTNPSRSEPADQPGVRKAIAYHELVRRIRDVISRTVPAGETVLVVSKGDPELTDLQDRRGWHFPRGAGGGYAGYYPADGQAAIEHIEELVRQGATFLVFPQTSLWWLDRYDGLRSYLETRHEKIFHDEGTAAVFSLRTTTQRTNAGAGESSDSGVKSSPALGTDGDHHYNGERRQKGAGRPVDPVSRGPFAS
jgi:hypothetical protein